MNDLKTKLETTGLSLAEFCKLTGTPYNTALQWKSKKRRTPPIVFAWLELYTKKPPV